MCGKLGLAPLPWAAGMQPEAFGHEPGRPSAMGLWADGGSGGAAGFWMDIDTEREERRMRRVLRLFLVVLLSFLMAGCSMPAQQAGGTDSPGGSGELGIAGTESRSGEDGSADSRETEEPEEGGDEESPPEEHLSAEPSGEASSPEEEPDMSVPGEAGDGESGEGREDSALSEDGAYTAKEDVALYLHLYGHLPSNFITKKEAEKLGWEGGSLEPYAPGKCIGGSRFGNYEGLLPEAEGRWYTECDIDTLGADKRGAKRIVFSNDGLIYYTEDHYESFELLYGEE